MASGEKLPIHFKNVLSLTPALSRWEREDRTPRWLAKACASMAGGRRSFSLSQRERAGVRENAPLSPWLMETTETQLEWA